MSRLYFLMAVTLLACTIPAAFATPVSCGAGTYNSEYCGYADGAGNVGLGRCSVGQCALFGSFCKDKLPCLYSTPTTQALTSLDVTVAGGPTNIANRAAECVKSYGAGASDPFTCSYSSCSGAGVYSGALCAFEAADGIVRQQGTCVGPNSPQALSCSLGVVTGNSIVGTCGQNNAPTGTPCLAAIGAQNSPAKCTSSGTCGFLTCIWGNTACYKADGSSGTCTGSPLSCT